MSSIYAWPHNDIRPPAPIKPMIYLDSNLHRLNVPAGVYGGIFNPGFQLDSGLKWWADYLTDKLGFHPIAHLKSIGVTIDFIHADIEWEENKLPFPYIDCRTVTDKFLTMRTILRRAFPGAPICFYGDQWQVEHVAPNGRVTGRHPFHGWQERDARVLGSMRNYVNIHWQQPWAAELALRMAQTHHLIHWVCKAKAWETQYHRDGKTPITGNDGTPLQTQADRELVAPDIQRNYGATLAGAKRPVMLYWVEDWNHPNAQAFVEGMKAATV